MVSDESLSDAETLDGSAYLCRRGQRRRQGLHVAVPLHRYQDHAAQQLQDGRAGPGREDKTLRLSGRLGVTLIGLLVVTSRANVD